MAQVKTMEPKSYDEIISSNNRDLKHNLIPAGYKKLETSKIYDDAFQKPIDLPSYEIDKLIK